MMMSFHYHGTTKPKISSAIQASKNPLFLLWLNVIASPNLLFQRTKRNNIDNHSHIHYHLPMILSLSLLRGYSNFCTKIFSHLQICWYS